MIKVERTFPAPESLAEEARKASGSYNKPDVVQQLKHDFYDKCYICGSKGLQDPEVEHLLPHKQGKYRDRMFDWNNLFWSCGHCNGVKNQNKYDEMIIDCCQVDPEELIAFRTTRDNVEIVVKDTMDQKLMSTAELVWEVFNLTNTGMREIKSKQRLDALQEQMNLLYRNLEKYKVNPESKIVLRTLKVLLNRESAFAEYKRCYVREHEKEYAELQIFLS